MATPKQPNLETSLSDRDLLTQFVTKRDGASFHLLVTRHSGVVWSVCRRMLSCPQDREDVFQATFLKLLPHANRGTWHETIGGWLHRVAYRLSLDICTARARQNLVAPIEEPWIKNNCLEEIQRQDAERALHEEIAQLPRRDRQAIMLHYFQNKSYEMAAAEMGCSLTAFKSLLQRGRRKLYLRLSCRGLSCSLALVTLEQTLTAAMPVLPELIDKTAFVGFNHPVSGGTVPSLPRIESLSQQGFSSMFQSGIATNVLTTISCYAVVVMGSVGWFYGGSFSKTTAQVAAACACQNQEILGQGEVAFVSLYGG